MNKTCCHSLTGHNTYCEEQYRDQYDTALAALRKKLNGHTEGFGEVTFHRVDGTTVVIDNLRIDGIGVDFAQNKFLVVSATNEDDQSFHVPFVTYWTVEYR